MRTQTHPHRPHPEVARPFIDQIRTYREDQGISQSVAAERIGMGRANWAQVEHRHTTTPGIDKVALMAQAVGLKLVLVPIEDPQLSIAELRAVGRLCRWYATLTRRTVIPTELRSALAKLIPYAMREDIPR